MKSNENTDVSISTSDIENWPTTAQAAKALTVSHSTVIRLANDRRRFSRRYDGRAVERLAYFLQLDPKEPLADDQLVATIEAYGRRQFAAGRHAAREELSAPDDTSPALGFMLDPERERVQVEVPDPRSDGITLRVVDVTDVLELAPAEAALAGLKVPPMRDEDIEVEPGRRIRVAVARDGRGRITGVTDLHGALVAAGGVLSFAEDLGRLTSVAPPAEVTTPDLPAAAAGVDLPADPAEVLAKVQALAARLAGTVEQPADPWDDSVTPRG